MADNSTTSGDSGRTIDQHLEENGSPGTLRTLRRVRRAKDSQSNPTNLPTGSQLWENANAAITSRQQQPLQQQTREQRTSAAEQELVLTAASLRRSAAARARLNGDTDADDDSNGIDGIDDDGPSILDGLEMNDVMDNDAAIMEVVDENNTQRRNHGHRHGVAIPLGGRGGRTGRGRGRRTSGTANVVVPVYKTGRTTHTQNWTFFIAFMRWRDSTNYAKDHHFSDAELRSITPNCICRYIKLKAFGNADADPEREYPTVGRASSSAQYKKSISKFMLDDYP